MSKYTSTAGRCPHRWIWIGICLAAWASTVPAEPPIPPHTAVYEVVRKGKAVGRVHMALTATENGGYAYDGQTEATSFLARLMRYSATESARFTWDDDRRIRPQAYRQAEQRIGHDEHWSADFDWIRRRVRGASNTGPLDVALPDRALDPLTLRLQLAVDLAAGMLATTYPTVDGTRVDYNRFVRQGTETVTIDGTCLDALRLERLKPGSSRRLFSWHSAAYHWLPVRILQQRDGEDMLDIRLVESSLLTADEPCRTG